MPAAGLVKAMSDERGVLFFPLYKVIGLPNLEKETQDTWLNLGFRQMNDYSA